jgi:hypothetical protein
MNDEKIITFGFSKGVNEYKDETLLDIDEASAAQNFTVDNGILSTIKEPIAYSSDSGIVRLGKFFKNGSSTLMKFSRNYDYLNHQQA